MIAGKRAGLAEEIVGDAVGNFLKGHAAEAEQAFGKKSSEGKEAVVVEFLTKILPRQ